MAKISGISYILIGLFVGLISYFSNNKSLKFFIYIGFFLGLVGIIKLFIASISKKKEKPKEAHYHKISHKEQSSFTKYCQRCGNLVRNFDNFCSRCGHALMHGKR